MASFMIAFPLNQKTYKLFTALVFSRFTTCDTRKINRQYLQQFIHHHLDPTAAWHNQRRTVAIAFCARGLPRVHYPDTRGNPMGRRGIRGSCCFLWSWLPPKTKNIQEMEGRQVHVWINHLDVWRKRGTYSCHMIFFYYQRKKTRLNI